MRKCHKKRVQKHPRKTGRPQKNVPEEVDLIAGMTKKGAANSDRKGIAQIDTYTPWSWGWPGRAGPGRAGPGRVELTFRHSNFSRTPALRAGESKPNRIKEPKKTNDQETQNQGSPNEIRKNPHENSNTCKTDACLKVCVSNSMRAIPYAYHPIKEPY